jgi:hypothetical protein
VQGELHQTVGGASAAQGRRDGVEHGAALAAAQKEPRGDGPPPVGQK